MVLRCAILKPHVSIIADIQGQLISITKLLLPMTLSVSREGHFGINLLQYVHGPQPTGGAQIGFTKEGGKVSAQSESARDPGGILSGV